MCHLQSDLSILIKNSLYHNLYQLEQLECLRSWDTPSRPMITHTSDSHQSQSQSYKFKKKIAKNSNLEIMQETLHARDTFWSCLIICINMKWIQPKL